MEKELNKQVNRYKILDSLEDLSLVKEFIQIFNSVIIYDELEIEPFIEFSIPFQAEYWYLKYSLLRNGQFVLESNEQKALYDEKKLNIIWLSVKSNDDIVIECKDGDWFITLVTQNEKSNFFLKNYNLSVVK